MNDPSRKISLAGMDIGTLTREEHDLRDV